LTTYRMPARGRPCSSARCLGLLFVLFAAAAPASAEGPGALPAGAVELGIAGGYSVSFFDHQRGLDTVYGTNGLLRLGWLMTDEHGSNAFRGNLELVLEPTYIHLDSQPSGDVFGAAFLPRWLLVGNDTIRPYVQAGGGILGGRVGPRTGDCDLNFLLEGGLGIALFVSTHAAIDIGYRYQHISNGRLCSPNYGVNSNMGVVGFSYFFH